MQNKFIFIFISEVQPSFDRQVKVQLSEENTKNDARKTKQARWPI